MGAWDHYSWFSVSRCFDPSDLQPKWATLLIGDQQANRSDHTRNEGRFARQRATPEGRDETVKRQGVFLPITLLRREFALMDRAVKMPIHARSKFVTVPIAAHTQDEGVAAGQIVAGRLRAHRGETAMVLQGHFALEHPNAIAQNKAAGGPAAHHVVVDDLPGSCARGWAIEEGSIGVCMHRLRRYSRSVHAPSESAAVLLKRLATGWLGLRGEICGASRKSWKHSCAAQFVAFRALRNPASME